MKTKSLIAALCFVCSTFAVPTALADDHRVYDQGTVWAVSFIETKPGHFDDYIENLSNIWKRYLDAQKEDGLVLSYRMFNVAFPRDGEPDLMLMVEFANWAAFDAGNEYFDKLAERLQGSIESARQSNVDREKLRSLRGGFVAQELSFKK